MAGRCISIVIALIISIPLWAGEEMDRCRERLGDISEKVDEMAGRYLIYETGRPNPCLGISERISKPEPFEGSLDECAHEIFEKRAEFRDLRDNLIHSQRDFCEGRPTFCRTPPMLAFVGPVETIEECNERLGLVRAYNAELREILNNAREFRTSIGKELSRVLSMRNRGSDGAFDGRFNDCDLFLPSVSKNEFERCQYLLSCESENGRSIRRSLEDIYDITLGRYERICEHLF